MTTKTLGMFRPGNGRVCQPQECHKEKLEYEARENGYAKLQVEDSRAKGFGKAMKVTLRVWRQKDGNSEGKFEEYAAENLNSNMSFLEMLDVVNEDLIEKGEEPIASCP